MIPSSYQPASWRNVLQDSTGTIAVGFNVGDDVVRVRLEAGDAEKLMGVLAEYCGGRFVPYQRELSPEHLALGDYIVERIYDDAAAGEGPLAEVLEAIKSIPVVCSQHQAEVQV